MSQSDIVYINGTDLSSIGLTIISVPGWADAPGYDYGPVQIPGRLGSVAASLSRTPPRVLRIEGIVEGVTWVNRRTTLRDIHALCTGTVTIKFGDSSSEYITGRFQGAEAKPSAQGFEAGTSHPWTVVITFLCVDPIFYAATNSTLTFASTATAIALGNLPSKGVIRLSGTMTNPVIRYRDSASNVVSTMTFAATTTATSDYIEIDLGTFTITSSLAGNALDLWSGITDEDFISPDPADGDFLTDAWPKLSTTSGSGTYTYAKRYSA